MLQDGFKLFTFENNAFLMTANKDDTRIKPKP